MKSNDGGIVALSGYLYQMLAVAGLRAWGESAEGASPQHDALIAAVRGANVCHETFGQDAALIPSGLQSALQRGAALVQIKFSSQGTSEEIGDGELIDIANRLAKSAATLTTEKKLAVSAYFLVTNRSLSTNAKALLPTVHGGNPPQKIGKKSQKQINATTRAILDTLEYHVIALGGWTDTLTRFAHRYGVLPEEIDKGIERLVGKIFLNTPLTTTARAVSFEDLYECFTRCKAPKLLTRNTQEAQSRIELHRLGAAANEGHHVTRDVMRDIETACSNRAIIVFCGRGGSGKSASLNEWAHTVAKQDSGPFLRASRAATVGDHWLENTVQEWRATPELANSSLFEVEERLKIANPTIKPPLVTRRALERIVARLCETDRAARMQVDRAPILRLVVTCRENEEFERLLPQETNSGFPTSNPEDLYYAVWFSDFTDEEFEALVKRETPSLAKELLSDGSGSHGISSAGFTSLATTQIPQNRASPAGSPQRLLRDPATWRAFLMLADPERAAVLRSEEKALIALGRNLVRRFLDRADRRHHWKKDDVFAVLQSSAQTMRNRPGPWRKSDWLEPANGLGCFDRRDNGQIFEEALSGGLIDGSSSDWRWRNKPVEEFLLTS
jgi:hypothetical protein